MTIFSLWSNTLFGLLDCDYTLWWPLWIVIVHIFLSPSYNFIYNSNEIWELLKNTQINESNIVLFPNLKLLHQNHQYSNKDGFCNLGKTTIIVHNKMVIDLILIMNLVQCIRNFGNETLNVYNLFFGVIPH